MCPVEPPPLSEIEPVTETLHGIPVTDPYRWIEDPNSQQTRNWIERQTRYARNYLDGLPGRERIRGRVRELLDVKTYDTFLKRGANILWEAAARGGTAVHLFQRQCGRRRSTACRPRSTRHRNLHGGKTLAPSPRMEICFFTRSNRVASAWARLRFWTSRNESRFRNRFRTVTSMDLRLRQTRKAFTTFTSPRRGLNL